MSHKITLRDINDDNFFACVELPHENERFVAAPVFVLADAYACRSYMTTYAIYCDEEPVGLVMVRNKPADHGKGYAFTEIFIADNHLRKGYGRRAVAAVLHKLKHDNGFDTAKITVDMENHIAQNLFKKCGFIAQGPSGWNEDYIDFAMSLDNV